MNGPEIIVRADGGAGVGAGHLARCLALVQAWVDWGGRARLVSCSPPAAWAERYQREGVTIGEPSALVDGGADWAVLDGYRFTQADKEQVRKCARRLLVIDDHGASGDDGADLVVDQNLGATATPYRADALLGTDYALLRREFRSEHHRSRNVPGRASRLLVALGGSPTDEVRAWIRPVLDHPALRDLLVVFLDDVDDVASAMAHADIALSASGSTCWELCRLGLPAVLVPMAPNQELLAAAMHRHGVAQNAGARSSLTADEIAVTVANLAQDPQRRAEMAARGPQLVDGRGARRVVTSMRSHLLELRPVQASDVQLLWEWANDPAVRASAFDRAPIDWQTHVGWLAGRLADPSAHLYLASRRDGAPLGQVRFEGDATEVEISISVAQPFRGNGWGPALIEAGVRRLFGESATQTVTARIRVENGRSQSAFEDAAFVRRSGCPGASIRYVRMRNAESRRTWATETSA